MPARFPGIDTPVRWSEALVVEASMDAGLGNMVRAQVTPAMLVDARNRIIYEAVMAETQRGGDPSWLSVMTRLTERGQHQAVEYATEHLTGNILLSAQVQSAISSVVDAYTHSGLQHLGRELAVYREQHPEATPEEIRSYIESSIQCLPSSTSDAAVSAKGLLEDVGAAITERARAENDPDRIPPGLQFGIQALDSITKGLHPGQVCILAARPGCGKTSLAVQFAVEQMGRGKHGLFFSYEMSSDELVERMIRNSYPMEDWVSSVDYSVKASIFKLANMSGDIRIVDDSSVDETRVKAISRSARAAGQLDYIVVDYIQLMPCSRRIYNRQQELTLLSGRMKALAKEMEVPVLVLSQFSRASVSSGEPQLHHLRESGALEQDADKVILMWEPQETDDNARRAVEARVAKNRQGARGQAALLFIADYFMFTDRAKEG